jgi:RNA polymerase-binding transcription factor DksA
MEHGDDHDPGTGTADPGTEPSVPGADARSELVQLAEAALLSGERRLAEIERAIGALEAGTYGRCEICDREIEGDRLAERPSQARCSAHEGAARDERLF